MSDINEYLAGSLMNVDLSEDIATQNELVQVSAALDSSFTTAIGETSSALAQKLSEVSSDLSEELFNRIEAVDGSVVHLSGNETLSGLLFYDGTYENPYYGKRFLSGDMFIESLGRSCYVEIYFDENPIDVLMRGERPQTSAIAIWNDPATGHEVLSVDPISYEAGIALNIWSSSTDAICVVDFNAFGGTVSNLRIEFESHDIPEEYKPTTWVDVIRLQTLPYYATSYAFLHVGPDQTVGGENGIGEVSEYFDEHVGGTEKVRIEDQFALTSSIGKVDAKIDEESDERRSADANIWTTLNIHERAIDAKLSGVSMNGSQVSVANGVADLGAVVSKEAIVNALSDVTTENLSGFDYDNPSEYSLAALFHNVKIMQNALSNVLTVLS